MQLSQALESSALLSGVTQSTDHCTIHLEQEKLVEDEMNCIAEIEDGSVKDPDTADQTRGLEIIKASPSLQEEDVLTQLQNAEYVPLVVVALQRMKLRHPRWQFIERPAPIQMPTWTGRAVW